MGCSVVCGYGWYGRRGGRHPGGGETGSFPLFPFALILVPAFGHDLFEGALAWCGLELGGWGQGAVGWIILDVFDGGDRFSVLLGFGQVLAGDLEGVEDQAGSFGFDGVAGETLDDLADG